MVGSGKFSWSNTDREYTYDELLGECVCVGGCLLLFWLCVCGGGGGAQ